MMGSSKNERKCSTADRYQIGKFAYLLVFSIIELLSYVRADMVWVIEEQRETTP